MGAMAKKWCSPPSESSWYLDRGPKPTRQHTFCLPVGSDRKSCYRYQPELNEEHVAIADLMIRITDRQHNWGFGLCFLYPRNVKSFKFNHKTVYRIYCELSLNMRIKPKKLLKRDKPEPLAVPECSNEYWSMDFLRDR